MEYLVEVAASLLEKQDVKKGKNTKTRHLCMVSKMCISQNELVSQKKLPVVRHRCNSVCAIKRNDDEVGMLQNHQE